MIIFFTILLFIVGGLLVLLTIQDNNIKTLAKANEELKKEYLKQMSISENLEKLEKMNKEQLQLYEQDELDRITITINGKSIKKENIYRGKRAIIGDYNKDMSNITRKTLQSLGMIVDVVRSGDDIIYKVLHGYKYDVIFTNNMYKRGNNGRNTLKILKSIDNFTTPVILLSVDKIEKKQDTNFYKFDGIIQKPLNKSKTKKMLSKLLK